MDFSQSMNDDLTTLQSIAGDIGEMHVGLYVPGAYKITLFQCTLPCKIGVKQCRATLFVPYSYIGNQQCRHIVGLL